MKLPISVLILAKNEEKTIRFCIEPLRRHVREIIVCDTGSRDRTCAIARSLGAKVVKMKIKNDFSKVRNAMIELASGEWLLKLDADCRIAPRDIPRLRRLITHPGADAYMFPIRNYTNTLNLLSRWSPCKKEYAKEEAFAKAWGFYEREQIALFRRQPFLRYCYPVHESLVPGLDKLGFKVKKINIPIHHFEFMKGISHHYRKHNRYYELSRKTLRRWPRCADAYANSLEDLLLTRKNLRGAGFLAKRLVRLAPRRPHAWMLKAIVDMLNGKLNQAEKSIRRSIKAHKTPDNLGLWGWILLRKKKINAAEQRLLQSLSLKRGNPLVLNLMGVLKARTGFQKEAAVWFERAIKILPVYSDAVFNRTLCQERQRINPARSRSRI